MPPHPPHRPSRRPRLTDAVRQPTSRRRSGGSRGSSHGERDTRSLAERVKSDPALLERALKDPGLRSKLPDKYLSPEQLKARRENEFRRDVGDINDPLSGDSLINTAQTLTDREFDPLEQAIGQQEGRAQRQTAAEAQRAGSYYSGLNSQLGATLGAQGSANAAALQGAAARGAGTQAAIDAALQQGNARQAHDAQVRGGDVQGDAITDMAAQAAQQKAAAAKEAQTQQGEAQSFGDAQAAFLRGIQGSTAQQGGEVQGDITRRGGATLSDLAAERAKLRADRKGQFTDTLLKLRGTEADRAMTARSLANDQEKAILDFKADMAGLKSRAAIERANRALKLKLTQMGLSSTEAQAEADRASREAVSAADNATSRANNAASNATSRDNNRDSNAQSDRNNRRSNQDKGPGGFSHKDRVDAASKRDDAIQLATQYKRRRASRDTALQLLTEKYGSDFARVAVGAIYDGGAKGHLDALLAQRYGIHVPKQYRHR